jgi:GABA(A) receptor-associated protein
MWKYPFNNIIKPVKIDYDYKAQNSYEKRKKESSNIRQKYNNIIPVIVEKSGTKDIQQITKTKFLVEKDMTVGKFLYRIRTELKLGQHEAMFLFINNTIVPSNNDTMGKIYLEHMDADGFLYITYCLEHVFG